jgi:tetratricopeptide (TPR) repeat protein
MSQRLKKKDSPRRATVEAAAPGIPVSGGHDWIFGLILMVAVFIVYLPMWHAGFIWDDDRYVTDNPLLSAPDGLRHIWLSLDSPSQYFPMVYTVFRIEYALWGLSPAGYHWVNIALHAINALLVWRLLRRLNLPGSWLGAAIWALHPVQVESVAWVTELKNVLMCFFFLLALLAWISFVEEKQKGIFYGLTLLFFVLALFSKTTACTLPAALWLIFWLKGVPVNWRRLAQIFPFVALGLSMGLVTMWVERHHMGANGESFSMGLTERVLVASHAVWFYAGKLFWPVNLTFSYPRWTISASQPLAYVWLILAIGFGLAVGCLKGGLRRSVGIAVLFFALTLVPVLGFFTTYTFKYSFVADHYQYVASLGLIALVAAGGARLAADTLRPGHPVLPLALGTVVVLVLGALTWSQCAMYANAETLWRTTIQRNPDCWMAYLNLGDLLHEQGKTQEAVDDFQQALRIKPDSEEAYYDLGNVSLQQGNVDKAVALYHQALQINPNYAEAHNNLGNALLQTGDVQQAIVQFQQALQLNPDFAEARVNLGNALLQKGSMDEAVTQFQLALQFNPDLADADYDLGNVSLQKGEVDDAIALYEQALKIKPDYAEAQNNLGEALLREGKVDEAAVLFGRALQIKPDYAVAQFNLGLALSRRGDLAGAITHYQKALDINPGYLEAHVNLGNALRQTGNTNEAIVHYQRALELAQAVGRQDIAKRLSIELNSLSAGEK